MTITDPRTAEPSTSTSTSTSTSDSTPDRHRTTRRRTWFRMLRGIVPLAVITAAFLIYALPPYLSLDPDTSRVPVPHSAIFYPALVIHIFAGSIMLCCAAMQLWPWLRRKHIAVHRWSGRIYVLAAIPVTVGSLIVAQFPPGGPVQQVGNTMLALLFGLCTAMGYRAVRQRRFGDHREWMIRSFALAFSIVANRFWLVLCVVVFAPTGEGPAMTAAIGLSTWLSWVVNLLIAEWWLHRRRRPTRRSR
ncbi:DUF2306 domain-containing protein [Microlunatus soli]|uniref:Predicted membrane protein n=1 Tax=Microlunatus soli TaxID=630515 RepID=A0A1H1WU14_9ACTN|nr:DUF2306 domain-containing protein [Microlunatus soli]SDT00565.1 Predicted membrane protein [Microlunatus soli]